MNRVSPAQVIAFAISFIGLMSVIILVALRDLKNKINQNFLWFSFLVLLYLTVTFVTNFLNESQALWSLRIDLMIANYIPATFLAFSLSFTGNKYGSKIINNIIYFSLIPLSIIALLPITVKNVVRGSLGTNIGDTGPLYYLTLVYFIAVLAYAFWILIKNAKNADRVTKLQTGFISFGLGTTVAINLIVVFAFPYIGRDWVNVGNLIGAPSIIILVFSLIYAVVGQHMFDVRGLILRSVGFFLIVGLTSGLFIGLMLFGASKLTANFNPTLSQYIYFIVAAIIGGMVFRPAVDFIEKKFSGLFSPTKYNPQAVINKVSNLISTTTDVDDIFIGVSDIITQNMNVTKTIQVVLSKGQVIFRSTDVNSYPTDEEFKQLGDENINIDETNDQQKLAILRKYGVNVYMLLKVKDEKQGYLMIGPKKNGLSYDSVDLITFANIAGQLSIALKNIAYYYEISSFNKTLEKKINEATDELQIANEKLRESDEAKDDFISMASHQLSTPIASIEGYLSMANNGYLGELNPKLSEALQSAAGRTKVMKGIIDDLLNVSHMTSGKFSLALESNDLSSIVQEEVKQSEQIARQHETELNFHKSATDIGNIVCDGPKVRQVIANFITNAVQYTPKGHVDVYIDKKPNGVQVLVRDDGIGVPESQKPRLFQKFFRAENAKKERPSGNGIGLYVAKKVIEEHGGKIIFQSTQGHGSTFGFFLPFKPAGYETKKPVEAQADKSIPQAV